MASVRAGIAWLVLLASAGCAPPRASANSGGPIRETNGVTASSPAEAGAPRVCTHDAKDLAPCAEDCDRAIAFACAVVATRTERGDGVGVDLTRAVHLHERACDLRDAPSCVSAARMHASGRGVPPSRTKQIELLALACMLGDAHSCGIPAKALSSGTGVQRDERRAAELWQRGCAGGDSSACAEAEAAAP